MPLCETCLNTVEEEAMGETDEEVLTSFAMIMGQDIADHDCEYRIGKDEERKEPVACDCTCKKRFNS